MHSSSVRPDLPLTSCGHRAAIPIFFPSYHFPDTRLLPLRLSITWRLLVFKPSLWTQSFFFPVRDILPSPQPTVSMISLFLYAHCPPLVRNWSCLQLGTYWGHFYCTAHVLPSAFLLTSGSMCYQDKGTAQISNLGGMWKYSISYAIRSGVKSQGFSGFFSLYKVYATKEWKKIKAAIPYSEPSNLLFPSTAEYW